MSIEIIPRVVEALHSREASLRASRECNASTTRGIISILIVLVGSNYLLLVFSTMEQFQLQGPETQCLSALISAIQQSRAPLSVKYAYFDLLLY